MDRGVSLESLQRLFRALDLTGFDAKVYATLLAYGPLSPTQLAERLETHRPQVHATLRRLLAKGLVESSRGKPALYRAVPPNILLSIFEKEMSDIEESVKNFFKNLKVRVQPVRHGVWFFKSSRGLMERFKWAVENAQVDLAVCGDASFISKLKGLLLKAQERGVTVYVIVYEIPGISFSGEDVEGFRKVKRAVSGDLMVVADSKIAVLAQRRTGAKSMPGYGLVVEEPVLIDYLLHDYYNRWLRSKTITDEMPKLPVRFTIFRLALVEAKRLLDSGIELWGVFTGRKVGGKKAVVEGKIVKAFTDPETGVARFIVNINGETVTMGGPDAIVEDYAVEEVLLKGGEGV